MVSVSLYNFFNPAKSKICSLGWNDDNVTESTLTHPWHWWTTEAKSDVEYKIIDGKLIKTRLPLLEEWRRMCLWTNDSSCTHCMLWMEVIGCRGCGRLLLNINWSISNASDYILFTLFALSPLLSSPDVFEGASCRCEYHGVSLHLWNVNKKTETSLSLSFSYEMLLWYSCYHTFISMINL